MGSRFLLDLNRVARLAIVLLAVVLVPTASAQAASVSQKIYKIYTTEYRAEIAYSNTDMQTNLNAAQSSLGSTAGSIDALSSSNITAATALVDELENQYDAAGAKGLFTPAKAMFTALSKLRLTHREHKAAVADEAYVTRVLAINTPLDLANWQAAGFAPSSEPTDTTAFGGLIGLSLPSIDLSFTGSRSQIKTFDRLQRLASKRTTSVFNTLSTDWASWAAGFGIQA